MKIEDKLKQYIAESDGILVTSQLAKVGIPRQYLRMASVRGELERVGHGIYLVPKTKMDELYCIAVRSPQIVFTGLTACYLHGLLERMPDVNCVAVPRTYATNRLRESGLKVVTSTPEKHELGATTAKTRYGREVRVYNLERTMIDVIRSRNQMDSALFQKILKKYLNRKDADFDLLMDYAKKVNMEYIVAKHVRAKRK